MPEWRRIAIIGCSGAGKSTLAIRLAPITGLPIIHLDAEFWKPGWVQTPTAEWQEKAQSLVARERWIIDGNFGSSQHLVLAAAESVLWLDFPRWRCLARVIKRIAMSHGRVRQDMAAGCPEKVDWEFFEYVWNFPTASRVRLIERIAATGASAKIIRLRSPGEVEQIVNRMEMSCT